MLLTLHVTYRRLFYCPDPLVQNHTTPHIIPFHACTGTVYIVPCSARGGARRRCRRVLPYLMSYRQRTPRLAAAASSHVYDFDHPPLLFLSFLMREKTNSCQLSIPFDSLTSSRHGETGTLHQWGLGAGGELGGTTCTPKALIAVEQAICRCWAKYYSHLPGIDQNIA